MTLPIATRPAPDSSSITLAHLLSIVNGIDEGIVAFDRELTAIFANAAAERLLRRPASEIVGRRLEEAIPGDAANERVPRPIAQAVATRAPRREVGTRYRRSDGTVLVTDSTATPIVESGELTGAVLLFRELPGDLAAAKALSESELRLRLAMEAGRLGAFDWHLPSGRVQWSPTLERIHGLQEGTFGGDFRAFQADIHPEDLPGVLERSRRTLEERIPHHVKYRIIRADTGEVRWVEAHGRLHFDEEGRPERLIGVCRDVTEQLAATERDRQLAEEKLARAQAEASAEGISRILDSITDPFTAYDREWRIKYINQAAANLGGKKREELLGRNVWDVFPGSRDTPYFAHFLRAVEEQRSVVFEQPFGGVGPWFEIHVFPTSDGASTYMRDVTARKKVQQALERSEAMLQEAQRIGSIGSYAWDAKADELVWSDEMYRIFDVDRTEGPMRFDMFSRHLSPDDAARVREALTAAFHQHREYTAEFRITTGKGEPRDLVMRGRFEFGDEARPLRLIGIAQDVTERKRIERELQRSNEELRRSNAELERFAYVASHDLQEPLRMVASYTQLLARRYGDRLDQDAREFIGYAVDGAVRMQRLIDDLLAYSRVGRGRELVALSTRKVVDAALRNLRTSLEESRGSVEVGELPPVVADESELVQLFQNLLGNALKFRSGTPPVVRLTAAREGSLVHFVVADNGIGIEAQYFDKVFVIFQRLHSRAEYPGTGIGLAICKKIVERHGGRIWVESVPGEGARFHFTLRAA